MNPDSPLKIQSLEKYKVTMTKEQVAEALGLPKHIIAPLTRAKLLKPLGSPGRYCVKRYSRDVLAQQIADVNWLDKLGAAICKHWRNKNAHKRAKQAGNGSAQPNGNSTPTGTRAAESITR
jgi:hypothetical protein